MKLYLLRSLLIILPLVFLVGFSFHGNEKTIANSELYLVVLGTAQDGGYPQAGCQKDCCKHFYSGEESKRNVSSLGIVDKTNNKVFLFDATPDFKDQWHQLQTAEGIHDKPYPDGIFITHGHIGHYSGLMQLGREVMGAKKVPVYAMSRMTWFLSTNGPWSQLISLKNIEMHTMKEDSSVILSDLIKVTPFLVPHRDEYSETVGFKIESKNKKVLFIPDIDKWEKWGRSIIDEVRNADVAFIDGTFFKDGELNGRTMKEVPHPFVQETMNIFSAMPASEKKKIYFIHFNHTNPLIWDKATQEIVKSSGFNYATEGMKIDL